MSTTVMNITLAGTPGPCKTPAGGASSIITQEQFSAFDESNSSLFGVDLFGDELIDMYSNAVGQDASTIAAAHGLGITSPFPTPVPVHSSSFSGVVTPTSPNNCNLEMGIGGPFQPSNSFNEDITYLLPSGTSSSSNNSHHNATAISSNPAHPASLTKSLPEASQTHSSAAPIAPSNASAVTTQPPPLVNTMQHTTITNKRKAVEYINHKPATFADNNPTAAKCPKTMLSGARCPSKRGRKPAIGNAQSLSSSTPTLSAKARKAAAAAARRAADAQAVAQYAPLAAGKVAKMQRTAGQLLANSDAARSFEKRLRVTGGFHSSTPNPLAALSPSLSSVNSCESYNVPDLVTSATYSPSSSTVDTNTSPLMKLKLPGTNCGIKLPAAATLKPSPHTAMLPEKVCIPENVTSLSSLYNTTDSTCSTISMGDSETAAAAADAAAAKRRRQDMTPEDRARQNRDRNREHARNTRLRKKAYVEELKKTLAEMVAQRDTADMERYHTSQRELEQREVRFRVMEELLKLRGSNEPNITRWGAIFEDGLTFTLPLTRFRKVVSSQHKNTTNNVASSRSYEQVLRGTEEVMQDTSYLASMLELIGKSALSGTKSRDIGNSKICISYSCDRNTFVMDGCVGVLNWTATSVGIVSLGATTELIWKGSLRGSFSPSTNRLISVEMIFDTNSFASQLRNIYSEIHPGAAIVPQQDDQQQVHQAVDMSAMISKAADIANVTSAIESAASQQQKKEHAAAAAAAADAVLETLDIPHFDVNSIITSIASAQQNHYPSTVSERSDSSSDTENDASVASHNAVVTKRTTKITKMNEFSC